MKCGRAIKTLPTTYPLRRIDPSSSGAQQQTKYEGLANQFS